MLAIVAAAPLVRFHLVSPIPFLDQSSQSHTYASMVGIAYFPVLVSMAPFVLGSVTSIIKLLGIPVLFLILGTDSKFLSC